MSNSMRIITWPDRNICLMLDDFDISIIGMMDTPLSLPENKDAIFSFIGEHYKNRWMNEDMYEMMDYHIRNKAGIILESGDKSFIEYYEYEEYAEYFVEGGKK